MLCPLFVIFGCHPTAPEKDSTGTVDADGDGYGSTEDCDDGDARVFPGAEEDCLSAEDEDCDGLAGECPSDPGASISGATEVFALGFDVEGDGLGELLVRESEGRVSYLLSGGDLEGNVVAGSATTSFGPGEVDGSDGPSSWAAVGDFDAGGGDDVVFLDTLTCDHVYSTSSVWLYWGEMLATGLLGPEQADRLYEAGCYDGDATPLQPVALDDMDGDGGAELLVAVLDVDAGEWRETIFLGATLQAVGSAFSESDADIILREDGDYNRGTAGDIDGDGMGDLWVGLDEALLVVWGSDLAVGGSFEIEAIGISVAAADFSNATIGVAGDLNGDGLSDLVSDVVIHDGSHWIIFGPGIEGPTLLPNADLTVDDHNYRSFARIGDLDEDGKDDIALSDGSDPNPPDLMRTLLIAGSDLAEGGEVELTADHVHYDAVTPGASDVSGDGAPDLILERSDGIEIIFGPF
ncbi:MAG: putative metal-binding motif-containing protein [Myxococcota bacterium]